LVNNFLNFSGFFRKLSLSTKALSRLPHKSTSAKFTAPKRKMESKDLKAPTKKEILKEKEKMEKIFQCYNYLIQNCDDEALRKKINDIGREHLLSKMNEVTYSVGIPLQERKRQLEEQLKKLKDESKG
jgi:hypothetical protein